MNNENIMLLYFALGSFGMLWGVFILAPKFTIGLLGLESHENITTVLTIAVFSFMFIIGFVELLLWLEVIGCNYEL